MNILIYLPLLILTASQPKKEVQQNTFDSYVEVHEMYWSSDGNNTPYPFTTNFGLLACSMDAVYFYPDDTADNPNTIGLPLNKIAQDRDKVSGYTPTVKNIIKPNADLTDVIKLGLDICNRNNDHLPELLPYDEP